MKVVHRWGWRNNLYMKKNMKLIFCQKSEYYFEAMYPFLYLILVDLIDEFTQNCFKILDNYAEL